MSTTTSLQDYGIPMAVILEKSDNDDKDEFNDPFNMLVCAIMDLY